MSSRLERRYAKMPDEQLLDRARRLERMAEREKVVLLEELSARRLSLTEEATYPADFPRYFSELSDPELFAHRARVDDLPEAGRIAFAAEMKLRRITKLREGQRRRYEQKLRDRSEGKVHSARSESPVSPGALLFPFALFGLAIGLAIYGGMGYVGFLVVIILLMRILAEMLTG